MSHIAVTGATGRVGSAVLAELQRRGHRNLIGLSRSAPDGQHAGAVLFARADYDDPHTLRAALRDVGTLVLVSSDGEAARVLVHHQNVVQTAAEVGVDHVVVLSSLDADVDSPFCYAVTNGLTELNLEQAGFRAVTVARASIFSEFFAQWPLDARQDGEIRLPAGEGRLSLVGRVDVGRTLAALASCTAEGLRRVEVTGPAALDLNDIAAIAADRFRQPIRFVDVTPQRHREQMAHDDLDPWWAYAYSTMFDSIRRDSWAAVSTAVHDLTGRQPVAFAELVTH